MAENPNLGSETLACQAAEKSWYRPDDDFENIERGSYRNVYRGPDGVVYKVVHTDEDVRALDPNVEEIFTFRWAEGDGCDWVPEWNYFPSCNVIAMKEYTVRNFGESTLDPDNRRRWKEMQEYSDDMRFPNVGWDDNNRLVLLDGNVSTQ